jgi:hypothetical protein
MSSPETILNKKGGPNRAAKVSAQLRGGRTNLRAMLRPEASARK